MIAQLSGKLIHKQPNRVVVDVNGVGYEVNVPLSTFYQLGEVDSELQLSIHTHVREDAILLFGFKTLKEKSIFEYLTSVSGVGPKLAITILSGMTVDELVPAIRESNLARLSSIPGVGKKTAERLVVERRDKLAKIEVDSGKSKSFALAPHQEDVVSALINLGYSKSSAERAVQKADKDFNGEIVFEDLLKKSLQGLSR